MSEIKLLRAAPEDAELIWNMQKTAFSEMLERYRDFDTSPANEPPDKTVKRLTSPSTFYYLISVGEEIVGAIRVIEKKSDVGNKRISPIFILPEHRNKGYAQAAIRAVEAIHGDRGWELDTIAQEAANCHIYEKAGYRRTEKTRQVNERMTLVFYQK